MAACCVMGCTTAKLRVTILTLCMKLEPKNSKEIIMLSD
jgi:hypothetical protein